MISVIHLSAPPVRVGRFLTQRCLLCGHVLLYRDFEVEQFPTVPFESLGPAAADVMRAHDFTDDEPPTEVTYIPVLRPHCLYRVVDTVTLLMQTQRAFEIVRDLRTAGSVTVFEGEHELPPGTCLLSGRKSLPLKGGPLDSGWYHAPPGQNIVTPVVTVVTNNTAHRYVVRGAEAVYVPGECDPCA